MTNIAGLINDNAPKLLAGGVALVVQLGRGILNSIPLIGHNFVKIVEAILSVVSAVNWVNLGANILQGLANGIKSMASAVTNAFKDGIAGGLNWLKTLPSQMVQWGKSLLQSFINGLTGKGGAAMLATAGATVVKTANSTVKVPHITAADEGIADKNEYNSMIMSNLSAANNAKILASAANASGAAAQAASSAAKKTAQDTQKITSALKDTTAELNKEVENVASSVTDMQSRIDKAMSQAKSEWSDGIFGLFRGIVSDIKSKDWSGLALDFAKLLWGQVDQGQREIIAQWAANALSAVNAGGGLSAAASSIKAIFSDGIAAGATEAGTAVQSFSSILEGLNASGGVGSALSGIASSFAGMSSSVISSLSGIVSLVMGNPILAAILGVTALAGGIALGSFLKKKSSFATSVTGNSTAYKDLQEAFWPGDRRAAAGYDALSSPYGLSARASGAQVTTYQQKMQASVDALYNVVQQYLPQAGNQTIQLDNGVLVGALVPSIDTELGRRATRAGRGG